jgi:hypothetical protein
MNGRGAIVAVVLLAAIGGLIALATPSRWERVDRARWHELSGAQRPLTADEQEELKRLNDEAREHGEDWDALPPLRR